MPILPGEIQRKIQEKPLPDIVGEEGLLHEVSLNANAYFAKRWNTLHEKGFGSADRYQENSPLSPYTHKVKYWEYKAIHTLFPDVTVQLVGGYDPRIRKTPDGKHSFSLEGGKPVTVSRAVPKDTELARDQQARIKEFYDTSAPVFDQLRLRRSEDEPPEGEPDALREQYDDLFARIDEETRELIQAPEFQFFQGQGDTSLTIEGMEALLGKIEQSVHALNPNSPILKMIRAGIVPIHPEVNFIPRESNTDGTTPAGTFIELGIISPPRLYQYIEQTQNTKAARATERMLLYQMLDRIFDEATRFGLLTEGKFALYNTEAQNALFQVTEEYKQLGNRLGIETLLNNQSGLLRQVLSIYDQSVRSSDLVRGWQDLAQHIKGL